MLFLPFYTSSHESSSLAKTPLHSKITWIIEDTLEWESYLNKTPTTASSETSMIVINGLVNLGYRLKFVKATRDRAEKILREEDNACMSDRIKTPRREKFSFYSTPHDLYLSQQLYRVAQSPPLNPKVLNSHGEVISLTHLFTHHPKGILAISSGTSYGAELDSQIAKISPENVFVRSGSKRAISLANMLFKKRVDYIIHYPQEINEVNLNNIKLESYTVAGSPPYLLGNVACAKTKMGKQVITHINEILQQAYQTREFYHAHERWLNARDIPTLRKYFFDVFNYLPDSDKS